ncbi:MAG: response regulator transcription factor [Gemmatimonadota bacterium]
MRILVVEDDRKTARFLKQGLEEEGYAIDVGSDGDQASHLAHVNPYDLVILDVQLPGKNGLVLAAELRREGIKTPILMLTARDTTRDTIRGLDAGADDYLAKPFDFEVLLARVRAITRRQSGEPTGLLHFEDLDLNRLTRLVQRGGRRIDLSPREFRLLEHFMLHPLQIVTRTQLLQKVWDMSFDPETNVVDAHVSNLRKKLEEGNAARLIQTVRHVGYILRAPEPI